jgi:hypothetical protein
MALLFKKTESGGGILIIFKSERVKGKKQRAKGKVQNEMGKKQKTKCKQYDTIKIQYEIKKHSRFLFKNQHSYWVCSLVIGSYY